MGRVMVLALTGVSVLCSGAAQGQKYFGRQTLGLPVVAKAPAVVKCGTLTSGTFPTELAKKIGTSSNDGDAQVICDAARVSNGPGACGWVSGSGFADTGFVYWSTKQDMKSLSVTWGAVCS